MSKIEWKRGDLVWWDDPDDGICSGIYVLSSADASPGELCLDEGNTVIPIGEARRPTPEEVAQYEAERRK